MGAGGAEGLGRAEGLRARAGRLEPQAPQFRGRGQSGASHQAALLGAEWMPLSGPWPSWQSWVPSRTTLESRLITDSRQEPGPWPPRHLLRHNQGFAGQATRLPRKSGLVSPEKLNLQAVSWCFIIHFHQN